MRRTKKEATSPFDGVSLNNGKWLAQYKRGGFYQRYPSEMEAFAHFIRVFVENNGVGKKSADKLLSNPVWLGRISLEDLIHHGTDAAGRRYFQFPVDRDPAHVVKVDERDYERYKGTPWFVRDGRITGVLGCFKKGGEYQFEYEYLDSNIYSAKSGRRCLSAIPLRDDGDPFNLTRRNLLPPAPSAKCLAEDFDIYATGLLGPRPDPEWRQRESWEEESWLASFEQSCGETSTQTSRGDEIIMPGVSAANAGM